MDNLIIKFIEEPIMSFITSVMLIGALFIASAAYYMVFTYTKGGSFLFLFGVTTVLLGLISASIYRGVKS